MGFSCSQDGVRPAQAKDEGQRVTQGRASAQGLVGLEPSLHQHPDEDPGLVTGHWSTALDGP